MSFRFCPYCHRGCQVLCYQQHMHDYFCHDVNCDRVLYPKDPEDDPVHQHIFELGYESPRPRQRYGYDSHNDVIDFRVTKGARDYVAPRRHMDSGLIKDHRPGDGYRPHRSKSHRGRHGEASRKKEDKQLRPYEIESPPSSPTISETRSDLKLLGWVEDSESP
ncbi:hypothetical protein DL769_000160 [Monosporascus sp. CRB-8-3]|nr:hypothetical protein DL769_000160 [Monosporascus sp. CRB-8-3]